ncbi:MAG TPA: ABC transporter ATP-binding protein [Actinomycetota bacterium]|nr:ABC transporter ATP-binding protein [Actinomycetota bacterium]
MAVIEARGLTKDYHSMRGGHTRALDGLDLTVEQGGVFGFLGPNGSGKTTTIRCLLGLAKPTSGTCSILGADSQRDLHRVIRRIGSIVETPALFATFTGRRNLELLATIHGIPDARVAEAIEMVGLTGREKDLVKTYSLGMRQRLAIAAALLKDPELLILDEPANGLDPAGIREVRELLRRLAAEGRTVLVSSHILSEVQLMCDRVAILSRGRCVSEGSVDELLRGTTGHGLFVKVDDLARGAEVLAAAGMDAVVAGDRIRVSPPGGDGAAVSRVLAAQGLYPSELRPDEADLETVFLQLTGEGEAPL